MLNIKLNATCALLAMAVLILDLQVPLGIVGGVPYVAVILIALWLPKLYFILYWAILCSALTLAGFYFSPSGGELWAVILNRAGALVAIWTVAVLAWKWKVYEKDVLSLTLRLEKEKIYLATISGAQHITNNLLNELKVVMFEIENHPSFDQEVVLMFEDMLAEAPTLMKHLSTVEKIDDETIRKSVHPA